MLVSNMFLRDYLKGVESSGHNLAYVLNKAAIATDTYTNPGAHVSSEQFAMVLGQATLITDDCFAHHVNATMPVRLGSDILMKLVMRGQTVRGVIEEWVQCMNLIQRATVHKTEIRGHEFIWAQQYNGNENYALTVICKLSRMRFLSWITGKPIKINHLGFATASPKNMDFLEKAIPSCTFSFNNEWNSVSFDTRYLDLPSIRSKEECFALESHLPRDFFAIPHEQNYYSERVKKLMVDMLGHNMQFPTADHIALQLDLSPKALSRRLAEEGNKFQMIKNRVRCSMAKKQVGSTNQPLSKIAFELGFSEPAAFWRAFKGWTGTSPQLYRSQKQSLT